MNEPIYTISQAASLVEVKSYVLRYWEEELAIPVARNEMGHRCYTGYDIQLFLNIKELKKRGLQLRAIKELIPKLYHQEPGHSKSPIKLLPGEMDTTDQPQEASVTHTASALDTSDNSKELDDYKMREFQAILEKLITQGLKDKNAKERENGCRRLDRAIRCHQQTRKQAAATVQPRSPRRARLFRRKR